jgi:DNA topoisomerase I
MAPKPLVDPRQAREVVDKGRRAKWWRRKGSAQRGFTYHARDGRKITDQESIERIRSLVIPPAWRHVRISPAPSGKVQALGIDARGRVQYLYHPKFVESRGRKKFEKIKRFGTYLPELRRITNEHLSLDGFPAEKVLALMVRLINSLYIRIGTDHSARHFRTYGITTLGNRHLQINARGKLIFEFVGKSQIKHRKVLVDDALAGLLSELRDLGPARKLFHYVDADGGLRAVRPAEINAYLKSITAPEFSAKDFRTWGATLLAAVEFAEHGPPADDANAKKIVVRVVKNVAEALGNTPSVCRASYIHPAVIDSYLNGTTLAEYRRKKDRSLRKIEDGLLPEESSLLLMLAAGRN